MRECRFGEGRRLTVTFADSKVGSSTMVSTLVTRHPAGSVVRIGSRG